MELWIVVVGQLLMWNTNLRVRCWILNPSRIFHESSSLLRPENEDMIGDKNDCDKGESRSRVQATYTYSMRSDK